MNNEIEEYLTTIEGIDKFHVAGSFRRVKEMSKDLDYIISQRNRKCAKALLEIPHKVKDVAVGLTKVSVEVEFDDEVIEIDFRIIEPAAYYHTLQHFTGSKDHNIRIRQLAKNVMKSK